MQAQVALDSPWTSYTSLDFLRGRVILNIPTPTPITSITCKLEGESRSRLMHPGNQQGGERPRPVEEIHKILYKLATLLPNDRTDTQFAAYQKHYLLHGHIEYPFEFKLPFNNSCHAAGSVRDVTFAGFKLEVGKAPTQHIKTTLPPTITAYPGVAEVRYFVKVTVNRKEFYKENPRVYQPFNFIPIEPPRPPDSGAETYARRQHQFLPEVAAPPSKVKSFFGSSKSTPSSQPMVADAPKIQIEARLPSPTIITCNRDLPLRLLLKRLSESSSYLYLQSIQIELLSQTRIRAHDIQRVESDSYIVLSLSNMNILLDGGGGSSKAQLDKEIVIDSAIWKNKPLPNNVAPTFEACNIGRKYDLQIRVGISHGSNPKHNTVVLPLELPVSVYSGIAPPAALVEAIQQGAQSGKVKPDAGKVTKKPLSPQAEQNVAVAAASSSAHAPLPPGEEEPPPSYEDAIAMDIGPVDGPRNYQPPPAQSGSFPMDEKGR